MKIFLLLTLLLYQCNTPKHKQERPSDWYSIITIENCQYLQSDAVKAFITHKGNCNNPIHCNNLQKK